MGGMNMFVRIALSLLVITPAHAASFDCALATSYPEKTVCADGELSALDVSLAKIYGNAQREKPGVLADQRKWLRLRNTCLDRACLVAAYQRRIIELSGMASEAEEICGHVKRLIQEQGFSSLRKINDEQVLGELCGYTHDNHEINCSNYRQPFDVAQLRAMGVEPLNEDGLAGYIDARSGITVSLVDINNDGFLDLHFQTSQGSLSCEKNTYLFGTSEKKFGKATGSAIDSHMNGEDAGFCVGNGTVTLKNVTATYSVHLRPDSPELGAVYRGMPDGLFLKLCQLGEKPKSEEVKRVVTAYLKVRHPDERVLLKKSIESIVGFQKPDKLAILDEFFSSKDLLQVKLPRHHPEHQFSKWVKGVSRELEQVLIELNTGSGGLGNKAGQQLRLGPDNIAALKAEIKLTYMGVIDKDRLTAEVAQHVTAPRQSPSKHMMLLKFARPAILGDKALVYAEDRALFSGSDTDDLGSGYGISFKRQNGEWMLIEMRELWSGSTYSFGETPEREDESFGG
jgi:uncharacterized protein